ncbi:hypothetical protein SAMN05421805_1185 [Saccharopolyspora antimicrobica]|uniref:Uncharacterized protein n=1 Tax=Saccharopolyspora antimicrobica TaxID=455193 RepID=A0A1I5I9Z2_9PSEU|nr:hypothetical protein [Saccharopolyspora antimicrobica]RKT85594.1 hypothetical protein ATL45_3941 [Saccharopolyspora antimicrobica]SFO57119.1 hypothetical protein SAMN05421805_1185 [Saccharopolyspora antimicrobica]
MDIAALLASAGPQAGVGGVLVALLVWVMRTAATDRGDYRTALADAEQRHAAELARVGAARDDEVAELRDQIDELRARVDQLATQLDDERRRRWAAEDAAANARRGDS